MTSCIQAKISLKVLKCIDTYGQASLKIVIATVQMGPKIQGVILLSAFHPVSPPLKHSGPDSLSAYAGVGPLA